ncbi:hypothetical protein Tco_1350596, partial [Tanacetum coccineum]
MFHDSDSTKTVKVDAAGPSYSAKQDLLIGSRELNAETIDRKRLESECEKQANLLKAKDDKIENLKARLLLKRTEAAKEARLHAQNEKDSLDGKVAELQSLVFAKDLELKDLNVDVSSLRSQKDGLVDQEQIEEFQDAQMNIVNDKVAKLNAD